jgi:hypothetical protein
MRLPSFLAPTGAALAFALVACSGPGPGGTGAGPVAISLEPAAITVVPGGQVPFSAVVSGAADAGADFSVVEPGGGAITAAGSYTAPQAAGVYHVRAVAQANPQAFAESAVTVVAPVATCSSFTYSAWGACQSSGTQTRAVTASAPSGCTGGAPVTSQACTYVPVAVTITPPTGPRYSCTTARFTASVTGTADGTVTWSVQESAGGSVSSDGTYTAPSTPGTYHLVATSHADPTKSATIAVAVTDHVISVALSPATVTVAPGATVQFTATVTTTCGTFSSTQSVTAP